MAAACASVRVARYRASVRSSAGRGAGRGAGLVRAVVGVARVLWYSNRATVPPPVGNTKGGWSRQRGSGCRLDSCAFCESLDHVWPPAEMLLLARALGGEARLRKGFSKSSRDGVVPAGPRRRA